MSWLRYALGLGVLALVIYAVDFSLLWSDALSNLTVASVAALLILGVVLIYLSVLKWQCFLREFGAGTGSLRLFGYYLVGYFVNLIVPSYVGGDLVRSLYAGGAGKKHEAVSATILERYTGFLAMVILAVLSAALLPALRSDLRYTVYGIGVAAAVLTAAARSAALLNTLDNLPFLTRVVSHLRRIQGGFHLAERNPRLLLKAMVLSFLFHGCSVLNVAAAAWAVGWGPIPWLELFAVVPLIMIVGAVPVTPGGLGLQEGAYVVFLTMIGASPAQAAGIGVVLRLKTYLLALAGGAVWLKIRQNPGQAAQH